MHYKQRLLLETDLLFKHYESNLSLIKYYIDLVIKLNTAFFIVAGGIGTFYLLHTEMKELKVVMQLPLILGLFVSQFLISLQIPYRALLRETQLFKALNSPFEEYFTIIRPESLTILSFCLISFSMLGIAFATYGWISALWWLIVIVGVSIFGNCTNKNIEKMTEEFILERRKSILQEIEQD